MSRFAPQDLANCKHNSSTKTSPAPVSSIARRFLAGETTGVNTNPTIKHSSDMKDVVKVTPLRLPLTCHQLTYGGGFHSRLIMYTA